MFLRVLSANEYTQMESPTCNIFYTLCDRYWSNDNGQIYMQSHQAKGATNAVTVLIVIWLIDAQERLGGTRLAKRRSVSEVSTLS